MLHLLEDLNVAAALIDVNGRILDVTRQANQIDELPNWGIGKRLQLDSHSSNERLWNGLGELLQKGMDTSRLFIVTGKSGRRLAIKAMPLPTLLPYLQAARVALLILDIDTRPELPRGLLRTLFRLTPAEARLTRALMKHGGLEEASQALDISIGTARQQLKSIFHKTHTARQADLLVVLGRIAVLGDFKTVDRIE